MAGEVDSKDRQILLKGVLVDSILEYAENKMIVAIDQIDFLLIDDFQTVRII